MPAPQDFVARMRTHAESAAHLQDIPHRHATLVLSLLPRPPTDRRSSQPPDLAQPNLDKRHADKHTHARGLPVPSFCIPTRAAGGWEQAHKHLTVFVGRGLASRRFRAFTICTTWHTPDVRGLCTAMVQFSSLCVSAVVLILGGFDIVEVDVQDREQVDSGEKVEARE